MGDTDKKQEIEKKEYADAYYHFYQTLLMLSERPEQQCELMGNFNVAWELRDDASKGIAAVLNLPGGELSEEQREGLEQLLAEITAIPDTVVNVSNLKEEHLRVMRDTCWTPIRALAKQLISLLKPETARVKTILKFGTL